MKTRARIVPVVAIALVAAIALLGAFAWLGPNGSDPGLARDPKSGPDSGSVTPAPTESAAGVPEVVPAAGSSATPAASAEPRRAEDPPVVPEGQLLVVVRRAADHSAVAGARVTWAAEFLLARERDLRGSDELRRPARAASRTSATTARPTRAASSSSPTPRRSAAATA